MTGGPVLRTPVVFFTGAGISVGAGLPTYRGTGGIYENSSLEPPNADDVTPERLPALWDRFRSRLEAFGTLAPSRAHMAIAEFERQVDAPVTVVTQNVDGLHVAAGSTQVRELHGTLMTMRCLGPGHVHSVGGRSWPQGTAPSCPMCSAPCRPNIVLFGEALPQDTFASAGQAIAAAATVVAIGTSAQVFPAAGLISPRLTEGADRIWINPETPPPNSGWHWRKGSADTEVVALLNES